MLLKNLFTQNVQLLQNQPLLDKNSSAYIPIQCTVVHISCLPVCDKNKPRL